MFYLNDFVFDNNWTKLFEKQSKYFDKKIAYFLNSKQKRGK